MLDTLEIFGKEFKDVAGIKATNDSDETLTFLRNHGNAVSVIDTEDAAGGIVRSIQGVDITDSTITADKILSGYTGYNRLGNKIIGTAPTDAMWRKIAEVKMYLSEYTDTSNWEGETDTGIDITSQPYAFILIIVTCDTEVTADNEWGMNITLCARNSNGTLQRSKNIQIRGMQTLNHSQVKGYLLADDYGFSIVSSTDTLKFNRKAHSAHFTKIRGGNYTIAVYGLQNIGSALAPLKDDREDVCEPKDVDFIDYDGKLVYSYTEDEFLNLTALPPNPVNYGLVAQGWNWTLADAKEFVGQYGALVIGQNYTTDNGRTKIYIHIPQYPTEYRTIHVIFWIDTANGAKIYWGDGTETQTSNNANSAVDTTHTYDTYGDFVIEIEPIEGATITDLGRSGANSSLLGSTISVCAWANKIEVGNNVTGFSSNPFGRLAKLRSISIPTTVTTIRDYDETAFPQSLRAIVFPSGFTTNRYRATFADVSQVRYVSIPKSMKNFHMGINQYQLRKLTMYSMEPYSGTDCKVRLYNAPQVTHFVIMGNYTTMGDDRIRLSMIKRLFIPETVTSITGITTFADNPLLEEVHSYPETPPSLNDSRAFRNMSTDATIYVPYSSDHSILEAYKAATNWSTYADRMVEEGELAIKGLIAYYDIGDESTISSDGVATSKIENTFTAYTGNRFLVVASNAQKPSVYYSGYANSAGGMQIQLNTTFSTLGTEITIEYIIASNNGNAFLPSLSIGGADKNTSSYNNWGINNRTFSHFVAIINDSGAKIYVNNVYKATLDWTNTITNGNTIKIGAENNNNTDYYLGHVRLYNRALKEYEIKNNFKYFKTNCKAGTTAYDSSGTFVG